jgi:REP element-mobilizing transposase RayT
MSLHSYTRVWLHLVWGTLERRPLLPGDAGTQVSAFLAEYARSKGVFMEINFVNPEHVHALIDLPTAMSIEEVMHLLKGASSHWINERDLVPGKFAWQRGYGAFSVSQSLLGEVRNYIATQEEHHRRLAFVDELKLLVTRYSLSWHEDEPNR